MDFDDQAISWDTEKRNKRAAIIAQKIADSIELSPSHKALEFGCGTGIISFHLYDKLHSITCVDISQGMIDALREKIQQHNINNMTAYQRDINDENLMIPTYDVIYTSMALHHVADINKTLTTLYSLLKAGGSICIIELNEDDGKFHQLEKDFTGQHGFSQLQLKNQLKEIGFKELTSSTFYQDQKMIEEVNIDYSLFIMIGKK